MLLRNLVAGSFPNVNCCRQGNAFIEPFSRIQVLGKWTKNRLRGPVIFAN